jgi:hypothetical protein
MSYIGNEPLSVAFLTDTFSGNGSTVAFTMSVAPANTSSILVAVTGVVQDPSTYSVSGTTLTFSAAPPTGTSNISVRYLGIPASGVTTTAYRTVTDTTATAGQTSFTIPSYTVGYVDVFRNGVRLAAADFTATTGTTIVLVNPASAGDTITTVSFYVSSVLNAIPATAGSVAASYLAGGAARANWGAGGVLQVVNATGTSALSTTSSTAVSLGFTASITPTSATSKILVQFYGRVYRATAGAESTVQIWRGGSSIQGGYTVFTNTTAIATLQTLIVLDSPATTSSVTYSLYGAISGGGSTIINPNNAADGIYGFVLMEIAA